MVQEEFDQSTGELAGADTWQAQTKMQATTTTYYSIGPSL
jgi:hypothetical protein